PPARPRPRPERRRPLHPPRLWRNRSSRRQRPCPAPPWRRRRRAPCRWPYRPDPSGPPSSRRSMGPTTEAGSSRTRRARSVQRMRWGAFSCSLPESRPEDATGPAPAAVGCSSNPGDGPGRECGPDFPTAAEAKIARMSKTRGTLLWIDVPGLGSRVSSQPYAEGARMMRVFRAILLPPCDAFGGRLVAAVGDSFHIVFRRATDAVMAAAAVQDRAAQPSRGTGDKPDMRATVVSGEMRVDRNGVIGDLVDLAARVRGAAGRGDVVLSGDVFAAMDKSRLTAEELGDADGIPAEVRLYRLTRARGSDLPFGGVGLSKAGKLPEIGHDGVLPGRDSAVLRALAPARRAARGLAPGARSLLGTGSSWIRRQVGRLPPNVRGLPAAAAAGIPRIPRHVQVGSSVGLATVLVDEAMYHLLR